MGEAATLKDLGQRDKLLALPQTLSNITFWGSSFTDQRVLETAAFFVEKGKTVVPAWGDQFEPMGVNWNLKVVVPSLVFDEAFLKIERFPFTDVRQDWLYKRFDEGGLIWPYGEDQKEWLKASLSVLKGKPLEAFKYADNMYLHW
ncbi:hypothetical protein RvY_17333 [Ramazzottius varieornatus]|uniref:Uncharacterized protein n=1 Tax=Ramazzottius varieornatus TaxID=947166 RepID=A0A1D1W1S5_RAMVA|nr:hypothetical protein RvY_17333 [Ramazzottius varieornatus]